MQYRHAFHAGNFADVHKHVGLLALLAALSRKDKPFLYLDTHAGSGLYDLHGEEARRGNEASAGVERLLQAPLAATHPALAHYLESLRALRGVLGGQHYPGSPLLAAAALRPGDRGLCIEAQPQEARRLQRALDSLGGLVLAPVRAQSGDGYERLIALLPPAERRALVLIDPPYEAADEFQRIATVLPEALRRFATGVYCVWFPVKRERDTMLWLARLGRAIAQPTLALQLWLKPRDQAAGLNGSGLVVVNPPFQFDEQAALWQEQLRQALGAPAGSGSDVQWIVKE
jgi:23S rRNA (adenine2030-N6)-methyltransferase